MSATKCIAALGSRSTIAGWVAISLSPESTVALDRECVAVSNIQQRWDLTRLIRTTTRPHTASGAGTVNGVGASATTEADHHGENRGRDVMHEGHR